MSWGEIVPWRTGLAGVTGFKVFLASSAYGVSASSYYFSSTASADSGMPTLRLPTPACFLAAALPILAEGRQLDLSATRCSPSLCHFA